MSVLIATDSQTVIFGLGVTGLSVARYLAARKKSYVVIDTRENPPGLVELRKLDTESPVYLGELSGEAEALLNRASEIVLSPGVSKQHPVIRAAQESGARVTSDIEMFLSVVAAPVIGITGSNGKTTVTTLMGLVAEAAGKNARVAGNIGTPALDVIDENVDLYILELSSFQLETIAKPSLQVACLLNVSEDHMDRYDSLQSYCMAKQRIFWGAEKVVYNLDDKLTQPPVVSGVPRLGFAMKEYREQGESKYWFDEQSRTLKVGEQPLFASDKTRLVGRHNIANALAVFAVADAAGLGRDSVVSVLKNFTGLAHRCQRVADKRGLVFVNDSKATNVGATAAAIEGLYQDYPAITLIAGGDGKGADFSELAKIISQKVTLLVLIGRDASKIAKNVSHTKIVNALSLKQAVEIATQESDAGSVVLLSPACASFDMFKSFEDRGEQFIAAVKELAA